jgi:glycosyltransferase involved in cell wall biosynthesis
LKEGGYQCVVCSEAFQTSTVLAVFAKFFSGKKFGLVVWQELARHQRFLKELPSRFFYAVILKRICDSQIDLYVPRGGLARKFLLDFGIPERKVSPPIPHGVYSKVFFPGKDIVKENFIFSPSRLVQAKGVDILLKAFAVVHKERADLKLVIQGDGPLLDEYRQLAGRLDIAPQVVFETGRITHAQMREKYQKALLAVFCSRNDNILFSVMESVACGTPVIFSTGADNYVDFMDSKGGFIFPSGDYMKLAEILMSVLRDRDLMMRVSAESLIKSQEYFNDTLYARFDRLLSGFGAGEGTKA